MALYKKFIPSLFYRSIFEIDYEYLKLEGITTLFFDLDNTIIPNNVKVIDDKSKLLFEKLKEDFKILILSNNTKERVAYAVGDLDFIYLASKPLTKWIKKALIKTNSNANQTASIGDQLFTDIFGSYRARLKHKILVLPIQIKADLKRTHLGRKIGKHFTNKIKRKDPLSYETKLREYDEKV
jgi:HAD superfamily phosphatase (TIGR01668 family)